MILETDCGGLIADQFILNHLHSFDLKNKFNLSVFFILEVSLLILSVTFSVMFFYTLIFNPSYRLPALIFTGICLITSYLLGRRVNLSIQRVKLSNIDSDEGLFMFLCKYGETVEATIIPNRDIREKALNYMFTYNELKIHSEFHNPNIVKAKKNEVIKVRHWRGLIHFPILNS